jgi:hypothetical protein
VTQHRERTRSENLLTRVALHRCSFADSALPIYCADGDLDGLALAARFAVTDKYAPGWYTKGTLPYTFLVRAAGDIDQLLPVSAVSAHALRWNVPAIGIAIVGDFRKKEMPEVQRNSLLEFVGLWARYGLSVFGHDELPFASSDINKRCPGGRFSLEKFRRELRTAYTGMAKAEAKAGLLKVGVVF